MQALLHVDQLLGFPLHQAADRDSRPARNYLGHVIGVDLVLEEHRALAVHSLVLSRFERGNLLLELWYLAVAQLSGALKIGFALGLFGVHARLVETLFELRDLFDRLLLLLPLRLHLFRARLQIGQL